MSPTRRDKQGYHRPRNAFRLLLIPLLLALPLICGCLTTLAISAIAGSGSGAGNEHLDAVKETAQDVAASARDKAEDIGLSAQEVFESLGSGSD